MKSFRFLALSLGIFLALLSQNVWAQAFDYEQYPRLDFSFDELQLDLEVNPGEGSIEGTARYSATSNIDNVDSLVFQAAHMEIRNVQINDSEVGFNLRNDSLIISFEESYGAGESLEVSVNYKTIPRRFANRPGNHVVFSSPSFEQALVPLIRSSQGNF